MGYLEKLYNRIIDIENNTFRALAEVYKVPWCHVKNGLLKVKYSDLRITHVAIFKKGKMQK